jgi:thiol-disulfide isomerase/thioredoxin
MASSYKSRISSRSSLKVSKSPKSSNSSSIGILLVLGLLVMLIIIVIVIGGFYKRNEKFTNPKEFTLQYFYMENCGYCKEFNDTWKELEDKFTLNPKVNTIKYDIRDEGVGTNAAELYNVRGAPTIILVDNKKKYYEYNGNRTVDNIINFVESKIN